MEHTQSPVEAICRHRPRPHDVPPTITQHYQHNHARTASTHPPLVPTSSAFQHPPRGQQGGHPNHHRRQRVRLFSIPLVDTRGATPTTPSTHSSHTTHAPARTIGHEACRTTITNPRGNIPIPQCLCAPNNERERQRRETTPCSYTSLPSAMAPPKWSARLPTIFCVLPQREGTRRIGSSHDRR